RPVDVYRHQRRITAEAVGVVQPLDDEGGDRPAGPLVGRPSRLDETAVGPARSDVAAGPRLRLSAVLGDDLYRPLSGRDRYRHPCQVPATQAQERARLGDSRLLAADAGIGTREPPAGDR